MGFRDPTPPHLRPVTSSPRSTAVVPPLVVDSLATRRMLRKAFVEALAEHLICRCAEHWRLVNVAVHHLILLEGAERRVEMDRLSWRFKVLAAVDGMAGS